MPTTPLLGSYGDISASGLGFRNRIINGDCRISQRGSVALVNNTVTQGGADRIFVFPQFTSVTAGSQVRGTFSNSNAGSGQFASGMTTTGSGVLVFGQRIEDIMVYDMNGKNVCFSAIVSHNVDSAVDVTISIRKANSLNNFASSTLIASSTFSVQSAVSTPIELTTGLGSSDATNGISCQISFALNAGVTNKLFGVTNLQFELGTSKTPFESRYLYQELKMAQRYYQKIQTGIIYPKGNTTNEIIITNTFTSDVVTRTTGAWSLSLPDAQYVNNVITGNQWNVYTPGQGYGSKTGTVAFIGDGGNIFASTGATFSFPSVWKASGTSGLFFNGEL